MFWDVHNVGVIGSMGMAWDMGAPIWPYRPVGAEVWICTVWNQTERGAAQRPGLGHIFFCGFRLFSVWTCDSYRGCALSWVTIGTGRITKLAAIRRAQFAGFGLERFLSAPCPSGTADCSAGEGVNSSRNRSLALYSWDFEFPTEQLSISAISWCS